MVRIYKEIQKGSNLYEEVKKSLIIKEGYVGKSAQLFGIQLKSIAKIYRLDL